MVGSGGSDRSKEAVGMMALHEALRTVCLNSDWTYSVFWTIRHRPRVRGGNGCKVGDDNGSLMLMWEDGFCRGGVSEMEGEDPVRKAFSKMSIQLYNYGEGLMGKVASDKCHKWVFKEPKECEPNISNYWQSSFDSIPSEWTDQFELGIQTIAVIQAGHGLLQLGSCKIIPEDLHFVLRMRHTFESLGYQSGFYLSQVFSSNRSNASSSFFSIPSKHDSPIPTHLTRNIFNWPQGSLTPTASLLPSPNFPNPARFDQFPPHPPDPRIGDMMGEHDNDIKWPNGLSLFNALAGRADDAKILLDPDSLGTKLADENHQMNIFEAKNPNPNELLSLESHGESSRKMENKFKRSFTLPARMTSSSSSTSLEQHQQQPVEYRNPEAGMYPDVMDSFLE